MISRIILFIVAFFVWMMLSWSLDWQIVLTGALASGLVVVLTGNMFKEHPFRFRGVNRYFLFVFKYCPVFLWELAKANIDVAYRIIHPGLPIKPGIVKVKTSLTTDTAITFLANSITLTPGTLTVDVDKENGYLYIHWIYVRGQKVEEATNYVVMRFEKLLKEIFE